MKIPNLFITVFCTLILAESCVVYKPDSSNLTQSDYNKRKVVNGAHFKKKLTPIGIGSIITGSAAGAYVGYNSKTIPYYEGTEKQFHSSGSAVLGAFIGFTATTLMNYALGLNKTKRCTEPEEWIKKANKNYILLAGSGNNFTVIHKSAENSYTVKNITDARHFKKAFPNSTLNNSIAAQTIQNYGIMRDDYLELMKLFPDNTSTLDMKKQYVLKSTSVLSLFYAIDKFPETKLNIEKKAVYLVSDCDDALKFKDRFSSSLYNKQVVLNALQNCSGGKISSLKTKFDGDFIITKEDFESLNPNDKMKQGYLNAQFTLNKPEKIIDMDYLYKKYNWIDYLGKSDDILDNYWQTANNSTSNGYVVIKIMENLPENDEYKKCGISDTKVKNYINIKLKDEAAKNVSITGTYSLGSTNEQWDKWCNNNDYSATMVSEEGKIEYLIYGTVRNRSKFQLPVMVGAGADLYLKTDAKGTGFWSNLFVGITKISTGQNLIENYKVKSTQNNFYIPYLPPKSTTSYAVLLDFGEGTKKTGLNFADWVKIKSEVYIKNINTNVGFSSYKPSHSVLQKQETWQQFAREGLPTAKLNNFFKGGEYDDAEYQAEWQAIQDERARIRAEIARDNSIAETKYTLVSGNKYDFDVSVIGYDDYYCHIHISDNGGISGPNVKDDSYLVIMVPSSGEKFQSTEPRGLSDSGTHLIPPVDVEIYYTPTGFGDKKSLHLKFNEPGSYNIDIH